VCCVCFFFLFFFFLKKFLLFVFVFLFWCYFFFECLGFFCFFFVICFCCFLVFCFGFGVIFGLFFAMVFALLFPRLSGMSAPGTGTAGIRSHTLCRLNYGVVNGLTAMVTLRGTCLARVSIGPRHKRFHYLTRLADRRICLSALLLLLAKFRIRRPTLRSSLGQQMPPWGFGSPDLYLYRVRFSHGSNDGPEGMGLIMLNPDRILPSYTLGILGVSSQAA